MDVPSELLGNFYWNLMGFQLRWGGMGRCKRGFAGESPLVRFGTQYQGFDLLEFRRNSQPIRSIKDNQ
ncbi:hypothetical protein D5018_07635 [Parashewanella curva]|uniref:Uncharacterized protein n=1 Tax=Parashewanella curva TaxID=2338552 RepID=A0A3L8Q0D8_9GAMM|nr:hypothetical protein [Parashewanella curva]RLV60258.1 hypothetical protein D5018_07635 [Parashewanella curva]